MPSWFSSWLPTLPSFNFAISSSIQAKFISFVLKKTLGHLVKPGQLDSRQIDSQIGSGYVQINDLQLNNEAINNLLAGLPLTLHDSSISSVVARIPWPNPLTSTLGFSLKSLCLTFHLTPSASSPPETSNLADSVASLTESFVHEELSPREEANLWESFHTESKGDESSNIPGGLDPFLTAPSDELHQASDMDPSGISMVANIIERLLARFELDAEDIKITLIHPGNMKLTASVTAIRYGTDAREVDSALSGQRESRTLSVTGFTISSGNLYSPTAQLNPAIPFVSEPRSLYSSTSTLEPAVAGQTSGHRSTSVSPSSSSSSLDEDTQFAMSQSLAYLPPRRILPTTSAASSMYESAVSTPGSGPRDIFNSGDEQGTKTTPPQSFSDDSESALKEDDIHNETLLSLGNIPAVFQLTTPSAVPSDPEEHQGPTASATRNEDKIRLSAVTGVISLAIRAWHVRGFISFAQAWSSHRYVSHSSSESSTSSPALGSLAIDLKIRAVVMLVLPSISHNLLIDDRLHREYFNQPLLPPRLPHDYIRIYVESIAASIPSPLGPNDMSSIHGVALATVNEVAIFSFQVASDQQESELEMIASPLLLTDPQAPLQYDSPHENPSRQLASGKYPTLPSFNVVDWTSASNRRNGVKLSLWRTKMKQKAKKENPKQEESGIPPALSIRIERPRQSERQTIIDQVFVHTLPIHIFADLGQLMGNDALLSFLDEVSELNNSTTVAGENEGDVDSMVGSSRTDKDTQSSTPRASSVIGRENERDRLERLVIEDLNLDLDYRTKPRHDVNKSNLSRKSSKNLQARRAITVSFPMIRVQVRCPSPPERLARSGSLVIDLHGICLSQGTPPGKRSTRFVNEDFFLPNDGTHPDEFVGGDILVAADFSRIVIAYSSVGAGAATAIMSLGALRQDGEEMAELMKPPRIAIATSHIPSPTLVMNIDFPSVHMDISKALLDGLQYWADDVSQFISNLGKISRAVDGGRVDSRDTSLIGSRFFAKSRSGSASGFTGSPGTNEGEIVLKLWISEALVRLSLPRKDSLAVPRPFDITAWEIDALVEVRPEGKDQTVITLGVSEIAVDDTSASGATQTYLSLTTPRNLAPSQKSMLKLRFTALTVPETTAKETRLRLTLSGFLYDIIPDITWVADLGLFVKPPPGAFESVVPSERTYVSVKVMDGSIRVLAPAHPGAIVLYIGELDLKTDVVGGSSNTSFHAIIPHFALLVVDDLSTCNTEVSAETVDKGVQYWKSLRYAMLTEIEELEVSFKNNPEIQPNTQIVVDRAVLRVHLCADTLAAVTTFATDLMTAFLPASQDQSTRFSRGPTLVTGGVGTQSSVLLDDFTFKRMPDVGPAPDMIYDDLPTNLDYLDESFGTAGGLRELRDDDLEDFDTEDIEAEYIMRTSTTSSTGITSRIGGETIKGLIPEGIHVIEDYFDNLSPEDANGPSKSSNSMMCVRIHKTDVTLFLYDGYDWEKTRKAIEEEVRQMRRRLAKIRQLLASGQTQDPSIEETSTLLFNSVYIGLEEDVDALDTGELIAAIDEELKDDFDTASQSSWQSLRPPPSGKSPTQKLRVHGKRLTRSKGPSMEFRLLGTCVEWDKHAPEDPLISRTLVTVSDLEILDHIKTSTWKKFLSEMRSDSHGNIRESESHMVRIELLSVRPVPGNPSEEARLRAKILPLRLYVDQDAVDFLKKFFSFKDPHAVAEPDSTTEGGTYIQFAEIFPIDLKLDYKPRRVDYRALREGRTIELMNFFHFDGAEMTLRHITLAGVMGWPRMFEMLNDLWTPDVKATQLAEVISGVAPIRSVVNVGSGVADLVLLPIAQYKKDGRIVRGIQRGTTAFVKSTAIEAIKMGARLATGTQVILEQAEGILGSQFSQPVTAEPIQIAVGDDFGQPSFDSDEEESGDIISKYAQQPSDLKEGMQSAYQSLRRNLNSAAQTILAVPMEVYERSGSEGPVRSVIRAVPIAVLKPMIGASEAVSKTLLGLHNTLDPNIRHDNEAKYKHR